MNETERKTRDALATRLTPEGLERIVAACNRLYTLQVKYYAGRGNVDAIEGARQIEKARRALEETLTESGARGSDAAAGAIVAAGGFSVFDRDEIINRVIGRAFPWKGESERRTKSESLSE